MAVKDSTAKSGDTNLIIILQYSAVKSAWHDDLQLEWHYNSQYQDGRQRSGSIWNY